MSVAALRIALVGNPNGGKTALFNQLTGSRQKVANYAGVTVERKEGRVLAPSGRVLQLLDLPGAYSFDAASPDEAITRDVCHGRRSEEHTSELQSLMRISYAVFCLKKKTKRKQSTSDSIQEERPCNK